MATYRLLYIVLNFQLHLFLNFRTYINAYTDAKRFAYPLIGRKFFSELERLKRLDLNKTAFWVGYVCTYEYASPDIISLCISIINEVSVEMAVFLLFCVAIIRNLLQNEAVNVHSNNI